MGSSRCLVAQVVVDELDVEVELADVLRLEPAELQFDHHVPVQLAVVEEQVEEELALSGLDRHLGADECEAGAELAQEPGEVVGEGLGQVALPDRVGGEEVEDERVLDDLPDRFPVGLGDRPVEGGERGLGPLVQSAGDHRLQHAAGPALLGSALGVEL